MATMLDRGDHDEFIPECPWNKPDAQWCDSHDREFSYGEDEDGNEFRYCKICEEVAEELMGVAS